MSTSGMSTSEVVDALKMGFDMIRSAVGLVKDVKDVMPPEKQRAISTAIDKSEQQFAIAEATMAQALGYTLCKCEFPPTIMLTVGYGIDRETPVGDGPVYECPKCHINTAGAWAFERTRELR